MTAAWRLVKTRFLSSAWDGEGARGAGGRWNSVGVPVVYVSSTLSLALVEVLVHLPAGLLGAYAAVPVSFDDTQVEALPDAGLPADWREVPPPPASEVTSSCRPSGNQERISAFPSVRARTDEPRARS